MHRGIAGIAAFLVSAGSILAQPTTPEGFAPPRAETILPPSSTAPQAPQAPQTPAPQAPQTPAAPTSRFMAFQTVAQPKKADKLPSADQAVTASPGDAKAVPSAITAPCATAPLGKEVEVNPWGRRVWFDADWLHWWTRSGPVNIPLLATGSLADPRAGVLGQPGTTVLFNGPLGYPAVNGLRLGAGVWLDSDQRYGIEFRGFLFTEGKIDQQFASNGAPLLTRPFIDTNTGNIQTFDVSRPAALGLLAGSFGVETTSHLGGAEVNFRDNLLRTNWLSVSGLAGFRFLSLTESLNLSENAVNLAPGFLFTGTPVPVGSFANFSDGFRTQDHFYGGQLGARVESKIGRFIIGVDGRLGIGVTNQQLNISGSSSVVQPDGTVRVANGGVLALPSNIGQWTDSHFSLVPELGTDVSFQVTSWMQIRIGYNFLYWSDVLRPGAQIDPIVNGNQQPGNGTFGMFPGGPPRPSVLFHQDHYWAQGFSVGLRFTY